MVHAPARGMEQKIAAEIFLRIQFNPVLDLFFKIFSILTLHGGLGLKKLYFFDGRQCSCMPSQAIAMCSNLKENLEDDFANTK